MAIARALGATPGQVSAGLSTAQLLPTLAGVLIGLPLSAGVVAIFSAPNAVDPPTSWIVTAVLATLLVTAALTALPARLAARRPVAQTLSAEAT
ncbi:hypothetical protein LCN96_49755 [Nonomuraea gerenzanensis]|nr:hypothetical protein LCN96_49755 [Nonomuraea gerenzanensis]